MQTDHLDVVIDASDASTIAARLKAKRSTGKHNLKRNTSHKQSGRVQRPRKGSSDPPSSAGQTVERITAELEHLGRLPANSAYVRHRERLLKTALELAEDRRYILMSCMWKST